MDIQANDVSVNPYMNAVCSAESEFPSRALFLFLRSVFPNCHQISTNYHPYPPTTQHGHFPAIIPGSFPNFKN
jgi:hypothetical protein